MTGCGEGVISFLGIGSNMGDAGANCRDALMRLDQTTGMTLVRHSSLYRTEPRGIVDQPWFINMAAEIRTVMEPGALLTELRRIEESMGRRDKKTGGPRIIDLDILFYGQAVIKDADLEVPHREMHRRRFVLVPLSEIAPWTIHPLYGISVQGLLDRLGDDGIVEKIDDRA